MWFRVRVRKHGRNRDEPVAGGPEGRRAFLAGVGALTGLAAIAPATRAAAQTDTTSPAAAAQPPTQQDPTTEQPGDQRLGPAASAITGPASAATFHRGDDSWSDELTGALRVTGAVDRGHAFEAGSATRRLQVWSTGDGVSMATSDASTLKLGAQTRWDSDDDKAPGGTGFTINRPATVWRQTAEDHKGAMIEFQQHLDAGPHEYGIACENAGGTFEVPAAGYKRVGWILAHYDSPTAETRPIHQHLNFETCKADLSTLITRFQISWGEDVALCSFPNSNVRIFDNRELRFGAGNDVRVRFERAADRLSVTGRPWQFGESVRIDPASGRIGVGIGAATPSAPMHVQRAGDGNTLLVRNTAPGGSSGATIVAEAQTTRSRLLTGGLQSDSVKRIGIDASGRIDWGPGGSSARDTNLYRHAPDTLATDDDFRFNGAGRGPIVRSANGTAYRIVVADDGTLGTVRV